jgi:hypothetical protein
MYKNTRITDGRTWAVLRQWRHEVFIGCPSVESGKLDAGNLLRALSTGKGNVRNYIIYEEQVYVTRARVCVCVCVFGIYGGEWGKRACTNCRRRSVLMFSP